MTLQGFARLCARLPTAADTWLEPLAYRAPRAAPEGLSASVAAQYLVTVSQTSSANIAGYASGKEF